MTTTNRRIVGSLAVSLTTLAIALLMTANQINAAIFSPPRRALQEYHMKRINQPADYGLSIISHDCLDGQVPCLLVEPDGLSGAGKRGKILRQQLTNKGHNLPAYGRVQGVIVLLHGRKGRKEDLLPVAERFVAVGFRCVIPDLPAHGDSPMNAMSFGNSVFEKQLPSKVLEEIRDEFGLPDEPAALWGMSMGGAFAVNAAGETSSDWDAMMIVSSFANLDSVLESHIPKPWRALYPAIVSLLDIERSLQQQPKVSAIRPRQSAQRAKLPTLFAHGKQDQFVTMQQGQRLYTALASKDKQWLTVPEAGHGNVLATSMPLYAEMSDWLLQRMSENK